jgi:filamentous hemagglutinin family protein
MTRRIDHLGMMSGVFIDINKTSEASIAKNFAPPITGRRGLHLGVLVALGINGAMLMLCDRASSQSNIVPDTTLGNESSVVVPNFQGLPVEAIGGGAARGQNLFHSFQEFNVSTGRGAYFFSPSSDIQNILARVTGINPSQILGTLGTFGNSSPNLFLINPNGIIFGQNASLDVGGSFVATTANAIRLGDTGLFSASQPQSSNLLAINPNALFYNQLSNQGQIVNRSTATTTVLGTPTIGLQVPDGRSLLLVGGDVRSEGGRLFAPGGRVELAGVAQNGIVELSANGNELRLNFPTDVARADVSLTNEAEVNVRAGGGGSIAINARNLEVLGGSKVRAGIASGLGSPESKAGDIEVNATGTVTVAGEGFIANAVQADGVGKGGDINITTGSLFITDGSQVNALTFGQGDAGSVTIFARDTVSFDGTDRNGISGGAASTVEQGAVGNGGSINITTGSLFVTNGAQLSASTLGQGKAGSVRIRASDTVRFDGVGSNEISSGALSSVEAGAVGDGGNIEINTKSLAVTNGARLIANTLGQGNAGSVRIFATDTVRFEGVGSNGFSTLAASAVGIGVLGNGGNIEITTGSLSVSNGAFLFASTLGQGDAGSVRIIASDTVSFDGVGSNGTTSGINSSVLLGAVGDGGDIEITTGSLSVSNGAFLFASTDGQGNAGSVRIRATDTVRFDGGDAFSFVGTGAVGDGGDIEITTSSLSVSNGASLSASTLGQGNAGSVRIRARNTVSFDEGDATSAVVSGAVGNGGDIEITTGSLKVTNGAYLFASTAGQGNAGNVRIRATNTVHFDGVGSDGLFSKASSAVGVGGVGDGGDIEITTNSLEVTNGAFLSADTSGRGNAGSVRITATDKVRFDGVASNGVSSGAFSTVGSKAVGEGSDIEIITGSLSVTNGASLSTVTLGQGNAGNMRITANGSLSVTNGALLNTSTYGQGKAGSMSIIAIDSVRFDGVGSNGVTSGAFSAVGQGAVGDGGDIGITAGSLSVTNGAGLFATTVG